jgi:hypothetical protein
MDGGNLCHPFRSSTGTGKLLRKGVSHGPMSPLNELRSVGSSKVSDRLKRRVMECVKFTESVGTLRNSVRGLSIENWE